ncbi:MAG: DNA polymerase III subunit beta [Verrucomicrobia bacterium]|jgi:DNA polymerase-3 subunit beta|nr:DNA polymerase III subunit beta [Verrucomicrobiaceae bacterium]MCX6838952.1 DNA polymerase III subunit beta [Verrucomicrobiota bacterium]MDH4454524.1 DNA polymerase III subunit beta [Verrucomicrobiota bacterium]
MKFTISKESFLDAINQVQHVVSSRTTLAILSNVLLKAKDGVLELTTTDLDVGVTCSVPAEVDEPGATTLPARRLATIVRELPAEEIEFKVDEKNVASIRSGPSYFKVLGLTSEEFPALPRFDDAREFKMEQQMLRDCLRKTSYAISTDETRYVLNGILFSFKDNALTMVATDGRRLAMVEQELEFPQSQEIDIIVPTKAVNELSRLLEDTGEVSIRVTGSQVGFDLGNSLLVSKLIDGNYPNYRQVIPGDSKERIPLEREAFLRAISRVSLLTTDKSNSIKFIFTPGSCEIVASSPDIGEARETLAINYKGASITIAFNPEFSMAPLRNLSADEVHLHLIDEISPGVLRSGTNFLYVLMPMRVNA